jgi:predicted DNA-binding protein with PD1-like motif
MRTIYSDILLLAIVLIFCVLSCKNPSKQSISKESELDLKKSTVSNDSIPDVSVVSNDLKRIIVVRLKTQTDLLEGLKKAIAMEGIKNGVIMHGIGSVISYHLHTIGTTTFPPVEVFTQKNGPFDLLNINGYIINGRVHAHIIISDLRNTVGGHLEPGTLAYSFLIITIGVLDDKANMENFDNWKWN